MRSATTGSIPPLRTATRTLRTHIAGPAWLDGTRTPPKGSSDPRSPAMAPSSPHPRTAPRGGRRLTPGLPPTQRTKGPPRRALRRSGVERPQHVGDEILGVLAAGREADESLRNLVGAPAGAALGRRVHPAEACRLADQPTRVQEPLSLFE